MIQDDTDVSTWVCAVCSGADKEVCEKCGEGFNEKECEDSSCMENNELVCCGVCEAWWHQACHIPHLYPLPVGDWICIKCKECTPARGVAAAAAAENNAEHDAAPSKKKPANRKRKRDSPELPHVRKYPQRGNVNYGPGRPEGDGWGHRDIHGLDAVRSRTAAVTWTRVD